VEQYTEFLNAVAKSDPNGVYDPLFSTAIQRSGNSPSYTYNVVPEWVGQPVTFITFWNAARFANWLHNGQPTGAQGPGTTEDGAYQNVGDQNLFRRNPVAQYFIPTEDEWYKAAYHDKSAGLSASYFDFPTGTNAIPGTDFDELTNAGNNANYYAWYGNRSPLGSTKVGEFELSASPYGTFDQGGNALEWTETRLDDSRIMRGGAFFGLDEWHQLRASARSASTPEGNSFGFGTYTYGFRIAGAPIPEPSTLTLIVVVLAALPLRWRRDPPLPK
jgi:formylglycine-generating enzyme required for sulfatase activity